MIDQTKKILVVDDDIRLRELLQRYLTEQGFSVKSVSDAKEMDATLAAEPFDVMVLDLMLPGEDGLSICRRIRGTGTMLPIIMLTARGDEVDRIIGLEMATVYASLGVEVTVVEFLDQLIPGADADLVNVLQKSMTN